MYITLKEFPVKDGKVKLRLAQLPVGKARIWRGIDIRQFFTNGEGQDVWTSKGITISLDLWTKFLEAIEEVTERCEAFDS